MQDAEDKTEVKASGHDWKYNQELAPTPNSKELKDSKVGPWTAIEFISHDKDESWFVVLGLVIILVTAIVYFWSHDLFSSIMVAAIGVIFAIYAQHQPREIPYEITNEGIKIDTKFYKYTELKSFSIVDEANIGSVIFTKLKRFAPPASIYYDLSNENIVVEALSKHLPHEEHNRDAIDKLMRKVHF